MNILQRKQDMMAVSCKFQEKVQLQYFHWRWKKFTLPLFEHSTYKAKNAEGGIALHACSMYAKTSNS